MSDSIVGTAFRYLLGGAALAGGTLLVTRWLGPPIARDLGTSAAEGAADVGEARGRVLARELRDAARTEVAQMQGQIAAQYLRGRYGS